jgi:hypothetical protein
MAVRRASDSSLTGKKYNDASAGASKIVDFPDDPAISSASEAAGVVSFTLTPRTGGTPASYSVTSTPGDIVATSNNTTVSFTNLSVGTTYTFRAKAVNTTGTSVFSGSTPSFTMPGYMFSQTFNSTGVFTVPAGKTFVAITGVGAGGNNGGAGGPLFIIEDIPVTAGAQYNVQIAAGGGTNSLFGNILTVGSNGGTSSTNAGTFKAQQVGAAAGANGAGGVNQYGPIAQGGFSGTSATTISSGNAQIGNFLAGGGGGGHGGTIHNAFWHGNTLFNGPLRGGGGGGAAFGGHGGGGAASGQGEPSYARGVTPGGNANGPGGGGGRPSGIGGSAQFNIWVR